MPVKGPIAGLAVGLLLAAGPPASAAELCVDPTRPQCFETLAAALATADDDATRDRISVATLTEAGPLSDGGTPVDIVAAGTVRLTAAPDPDDPTLELTGSTARGLDIEGLVRLHDQAGLYVSELEGALEATDGFARAGRLAVRGEIVADGAVLDVQDVDLVMVDAAATGLLARCTATEDAQLVARHVTVTGVGTTGGAARCLGTGAATMQVVSSIFSGDFEPFAESGSGAVEVAFSSTMESPGFVSSTDRRLAAGSPLIDTGDPAPLVPDGTLRELQEDLDGAVRIADGDRDGTLRRDPGAHEYQPPPVTPPEGNLLAVPGAEGADPADAQDEAPEVPSWTRIGGALTYVRYGSVFGAAPLLTTRAGEAAGGGTAYFAGGPGGTAAAVMQRIDVSASGREIDAGTGTAALAGLLGGYVADGDRASVDAVFRDAEGKELGKLQIGPVTPADRGNATTLVHRATQGAIPDRTRIVDIVISAEHLAGQYNDAFADNLSLVLSVPGVLVPPPPPTDPGLPSRKPFSGVTVLTSRPNVAKTRRTSVVLGCASATVGGCTGTLELRAVLTKGAAPVRIANGSFALAPGRTGRSALKVYPSAWRTLKRHRSFRVALVAVARDGQGIRRITEIPLRLRLPASRSGTSR